MGRARRAVNTEDFVQFGVWELGSECGSGDKAREVSQVTAPQDYCPGRPVKIRAALHCRAVREDSRRLSCGARGRYIPGSRQTVYPHAQPSPGGRG